MLLYTHVMTKHCFALCYLVVYVFTVEQSFIFVFAFRLLFASMLPLALWIASCTWGCHGNNLALVCDMEHVLRRATDDSGLTYFMFWVCFPGPESQQAWIMGWSVAILAIATQQWVTCLDQTRHHRPLEMESVERHCSDSKHKKELLWQLGRQDMEVNCWSVFGRSSFLDFSIYPAKQCQAPTA